MPITITIRQGLAAAGGLLAIAGIIVLLWPVTATMDAGPFGLSEQVSCGSALVSHDAYGGFGRAACTDSLGTQRAWGWPALIGGLVIAGAALFVNVSPQAREDA